MPKGHKLDPPMTDEWNDEPLIVEAYRRDEDNKLLHVYATDVDLAIERVGEEGYRVVIERLDGSGKKKRQVWWFAGAPDGTLVWEE